jgi:hypothetical protein
MWDETFIWSAVEGVIEGGKAGCEKIAEVFDDNCWGAVFNTSSQLCSALSQHSSGMGTRRNERDKTIQIFHGHS